MLRTVNCLSDKLDSRECLTREAEENTNADEPLWGDDLYVAVHNDDSVNHFDLREVTVQQDDSFGMAGDLATVLEQEGQTEWHDEDASQALWRATLVKYSEHNNKFALVLSFHHLVTDAMGAVAVVQAIVNESSGDMATETSIASPSDCMEDVLDTVPRLSHLFMPVLLDRFPSLITILRPPHFQGIAHDDTANHNERKSNMVCLSLLNDQQVTLLREACRQQYQTTVNSICVAALCRALSSHVAENS